MMTVQVLCQVELLRGEGVHGTTSVHCGNILTPVITAISADELSMVVTGLQVIVGGIGMYGKMLVEVEGLTPQRHCLRGAQILPVTW